MTKLWQYIAWAHEVDCKVWGLDVLWMRDDHMGWEYHRQFPRGLGIFWRITSLLMAFGFLHGDVGGTYASHTWSWTFWRQVPESDRYEKNGRLHRQWRHYNLSWSDPIRKARRHGALLGLIARSPRGF